MRKTVTVFSALFLVTALSSCALQNSQQTTQTTPSSSTSVGKIKDPRTIQGLTQVAEIKDPTPIGKANPKQKLPSTFTDHTGKEITIKSTDRILALDIYGTITRVLISLGFEKNLIGRTVSDTEKSLQDLPVVTQDGHALNGEAIAALKPDLILTDNSVGPPEVLEQLKQTGTTVVTLDSKHTVDSIKTQIMSVAKIMGVEDLGVRLYEQTKADIDLAKKELKELVGENNNPLKVAFLYIRGNGGVFFIFGKGEGSDELIQNLYAKDIASDTGLEGIVPATAEALVALNPDVFFVMSKGLESTNGLEGLLQRPGVAQTIAGQNKRVVAIPDGIALSFWPQTGQVLRQVGRALYLGE